MGMTRKQMEKLDTIIGKLERLQLEVDDRTNQLGQAKSLLMSALRKAENA